jgi:tetratricopeptide (TPR) repeat protein
MTSRTIFTYLRLKRGPIAALSVVAAMLLGLVFLSAFLFFLLRLLETQNLDGRQTNEGTGGIICLFSWLSLALVTFSIWLYTFSNRSITFAMKLDFGRWAHQQGRYDEAYSHAQEAWNYAEQLAPDDPCRGKALRQLFRIAWAQGNYDDAESFGLQWIAAEESAWGNEHPAAAYAMEELAEAYIDIARYAQAKALLEKALCFWESTPRPNPVALALCLGSMGRLWCDLDRGDKAEPSLRRAFEIVQPLRERTSPGGLNIAFYLTVVCACNGKLDEAEFIIKSAQKVIQKTFPPESWQAAYCIHSYSHVRFAQKRYAEAEEMKRLALAMIDKIWKPNHPHSCSMWASLGNILKVQEKWVESEDCFRKALQLADEFRAPEHPQIAAILEDYGDLLQHLGRSGQAFEYHHRAAHIREIHAPLRTL